jgi:protein TonB
MVTCYETTAPLDTFFEEMVVTMDIPGVIGYHSGIPDVPETVYDKNKIYDVVEQMPKFPGDVEALFKFISENLKYPNTESCVEGKVILRFVVEKDGSVSNPEIIRSLDPAFDREALRIVNMMPKWIAGKQNGENVAVWFTLPITFRIQ